jgi:hypothetical protein
MTKAMNGKMPLVPMTRLLGGFSAPTALYVRIQRQIKSQMHAVEANKLYTAEDLCGAKFWAEELKDNPEKWLAGRCFAHMVSTGLFKFKFVQYKRYATKRYQLIS